MQKRRNSIAKCVIFKWVVVINSMSISNAIVFRWMVNDPTDDKSTLLQVMAWCCQGTFCDTVQVPSGAGDMQLFYIQD